MAVVCAGRQNNKIFVLLLLQQAQLFHVYHENLTPTDWFESDSVVVPDVFEIVETIQHQGGLLSMPSVDMSRKHL